MDLLDLMKLMPGGGNGGGLADMIAQVTQPLQIMAEGIASVQASCITQREMLAEIQRQLTEQGQQIATLVERVDTIEKTLAFETQREDV